MVEQDAESTIFVKFTKATEVFRVGGDPIWIPAEMTTRQLEIGEMVAEGLSNTEIARRLSIAPSTVRRHIHLLAEAIGLQRRTAWPGAVRVQIAKWWWSGRLIEPPPTAERVERKMYCEWCGEVNHVLAREEGLDEVWKCAECGNERWFRTR